MTPRRLALASAFVFAGIAAAAAAPIALPLVLENDAAWSEAARPHRCYYTYYCKTTGSGIRSCQRIKNCS